MGTWAPITFAFSILEIYLFGCSLSHAFRITVLAEITGQADCKAPFRALIAACELSRREQRDTCHLLIEIPQGCFDIDLMHIRNQNLDQPEPQDHVAKAACPPAEPWCSMGSADHSKDQRRCQN